MGLWQDGGGSIPTDGHFTSYHDRCSRDGRYNLVIRAWQLYTRECCASVESVSGIQVAIAGGTSAEVVGHSILWRCCSSRLDSGELYRRLRGPVLRHRLAHSFTSVAVISAISTFAYAAAVAAA